MAAYRRVDDLRSPAGWLPVHRDQLRAQRSVSSMGSLYLFFTVTTMKSTVSSEAVKLQRSACVLLCSTENHMLLYFRIEWQLVICSPVCWLNGVCETKNMFEVQTSHNVQQGQRLLHFAAFNKTLLQQTRNSCQMNTGKKQLPLWSRWPANSS